MKKFVTFVVTDSAWLSGSKLGVVEGDTVLEVTKSAFNLLIASFETDAERIRQYDADADYQVSDEFDVSIDELVHETVEDLFDMYNFDTADFGWWMFVNDTGNLVLTDNDYVDLVQYNELECSNLNQVEPLGELN